MMKVNITLSKATSSHRSQQHAKKAVVQNRQTDKPHSRACSVPTNREHPIAIKDSCIMTTSYSFQVLDIYVRARR